MDFDTPEDLEIEENEELTEELGVLPPEFFKLPIARILYPKSHDNPHVFLRDMAVLPSYAAWYIHQLGEAETELMMVEADWEQWYAHAYDRCRQVLQYEAEEHAEKTRTSVKVPTSTAIKLLIPIECSKEGWVATFDSVDYPHESLGSINARRILAKNRVTTLRGFCKTIEMKASMLPSQLSMAKELYKSPNVGMPGGVVDPQ